MGNGTLTLGAQNNYSGTTTISAGVLVAAAGGALGNGLAIQLGDSNTLTNPAQLFISGPNTFSQNITVNAANATLGNLTDDGAGFGGNITLNSSLTISSQSVSPGNTLTFSGNILHGSGTNSVTLTGPGNVVFLGNSTYQGATTINAGSLTVGQTGSLPASTTLNINGTSTVTLLNPAQTLAGLNGSAASTLALSYSGGTTLTVGSGSFAGAIIDPTQSGANLVKNTDRDPVSQSARTPTTATRLVTAGVLLYGSAGSIFHGGRPNSITVTTSAAVGLLTSGIASAAAEYQRRLQRNAGSDPGHGGRYGQLRVGGTLLIEPRRRWTARPIPALTPNGTLYRLGGGGGTLTVATALTNTTGPTSLLVNGPPSGGEVILTSGNNTYTGTTLVTSGTLQVGDGVTTNGSLPAGNVTDNGALIFANPSAMTFAGAIGGNGQLAKTGSGAFILTAAETYSGPTTVSAGTLQLNNGGTLNVASTIIDNGTLAFNNSSGLTQGTNFSSARSRGAAG